jgi:hypothetical protein
VDEDIDIFDLVEGKRTLRDAIQTDLEKLRAMQMRFAERLDKAAENEERSERLAQLSGAVSKAARAVHNIAVLQLDLAGERPSGRVAAAPANQNKSATRPPEERKGFRPCPRPWDLGDYTDYDDYTDRDRLLLAKAFVDSRRRVMVAAMDKDFRAAGRGDVCGQSPATKFDLILGIPHPAFDTCIQDVEPEFIYKWLGEDNVYLALGPGPPHAWAKYEEKERLTGDPNVRKSG